MSNTLQKIAVMQAFEDGKDIQHRTRHTTDSFTRASTPTWNWDNNEYRVNQTAKDILNEVLNRFRGADASVTRSLIEQARDLL